MHYKIDSLKEVYFPPGKRALAPILVASLLLPHPEISVSEITKTAWHHSTKPTAGRTTDLNIHIEIWKKSYPI